MQTAVGAIVIMLWSRFKNREKHVLKTQADSTYK